MSQEANSGVCKYGKANIEQNNNDKNKNLLITPNKNNIESTDSALSNTEEEDELRDVKAIELDFTKGSYFKQFCSVFGGAI